MTAAPTGTAPAGTPPAAAPTASSVLLLHPHDSVGVARADLPAGTVVTLDGGRELPLRADVPRGHKVAVTDVAAGAEVRKYGQVIGRATADVRAGDHVHVHNLGMVASRPEHEFGAGAVRPDVLPPEERAVFQGFVRSDGRAATRNYVGILTTVNCSATAAKLIARQLQAPGALDGIDGVGSVDGVVALAHGTGCGLAADGAGLEVLRRTLRGYARHPNFGALLVLGLGCEVNQISGLLGDLDLPDDRLVVPMAIQELGGTRRTVAEGVARIREFVPDVGRAQRRPVPASELVLGTNCGGSDGWSGVTANPSLGAAVDELVRHGGTAVLAETPEVYGAEHLLTRRAVSPQVAERLLERIRWWERYTADNGGDMDNNPSPGNKAGGLTTILEKSLGAVAKGGTTALTAVHEYAEPLGEKGFVFMDTPGYDPVSVTGIVAGGANVVCFTTGRGSVFGCKPAPSLKLATNSDVYRRMEDDMDVDCGVVLEGTSVEEMGRRIFDLVLETASGRRTKSEEIGVGDEEFTPWQLGAVM
ncbi:altronate dehydratase family protein [Kineococcus glutinatus]|uniref:Altronate dehydratase family protein n=1 Tax=Kineococcus glutinatus TaxID=1070872 RepID=A0ABP9HC53_9ACTN